MRTNAQKLRKILGCLWCTSYKMAGLQVNLGTPCILIEHLDLIVINWGSSKYRNGNEGTHRWNQRWTRYSSPHSSIVPLKWPLMDKMHIVSPCSSTPTHQMQYYESLELERCLCALGPLGCTCIMGQEVQQSTKNMFFFPSTELRSKPGGFDLHTPSSSAEKTWTYGLSMGDDVGGFCCCHTTTSPEMMELVSLSIGNLVFQRV